MDHYYRQLTPHGSYKLLPAAGYNAEYLVDIDFNSRFRMPDNTKHVSAQELIYKMEKTLIKEPIIPPVTMAHIPDTYATYHEYIHGMGHIKYPDGVSIIKPSWLYHKEDYIKEFAGEIDPKLLQAKEAIEFFQETQVTQPPHVQQAMTHLLNHAAKYFEGDNNYHEKFSQAAFILADDASTGKLEKIVNNLPWAEAYESKTDTPNTLRQNSLSTKSNHAKYVAEMHGDTYYYGDYDSARLSPLALIQASEKKLIKHPIDNNHLTKTNSYVAGELINNNTYSLKVSLNQENIFTRVFNTMQIDRQLANTTEALEKFKEARETQTPHVQEAMNSILKHAAGYFRAERESFNTNITQVALTLADEAMSGKLKDVVTKLPWKEHYEAQTNYPEASHQPEVELTQ